MKQCEAAETKENSESDYRRCDRLVVKIAVVGDVYDRRNPNERC